mgnify:CR=1 FL=1
MIWPPLKAWTSKTGIDGQIHFVAINYGGELLERWVVLMSVLDSSVVLKVSWTQLIDPSDWECGWSEINYLNSTKQVNRNCEIRISDCTNPSVDSGLTIPITKNTIRPWFSKI